MRLSSTATAADPEPARRRRRSDPHSFDAWWHDGQWSRSVSPGLDMTTNTIPVVREAPPVTREALPLARDEVAARASADAAGRTFFAILFWFALATSCELWWLNTPAGSLAS